MCTPNVSITRVSYVGSATIKYMNILGLLIAPFESSIMPKYAIKQLPYAHVLNYIIPSITPTRPFLTSPQHQATHNVLKQVKRSS